MLTGRSPGAARGVLEAGRPCNPRPSMINPTGLDYHGTTMARYDGPGSAGVDLLPGEAHRLDANLDRIAHCGETWYRYHRVQEDEGSRWEEQLIAPRQCGQRGCPSCGERARQRHRQRVLGRWHTAVLLTLPQAALSVGEAWRQIHSHLARWIRKLRTALKTGSWAVRGGERLSYSWALECHSSGYPHVHLVTDCRWISWEWIRRTWGETIGFGAPFVSCQRVRDESEACAYLAKYVAKTVLPLDLLAVLYRKRLWASTLRKRPREEAPWVEIGRVSEPQAEALVDSIECDEQGDGWRLLYRTRQGGAYAVRPWVEDRRPDDEESLDGFERLRKECGGEWYRPNLTPS